MLDAIQPVIQRITASNGTAHLVGGAVIDFINGNVPKDFDIEVFGLNYEKLESIFSDLSPKTIGKSFGIIKITINDLDIDLSIPRKDNKTGVGHNEFSVTFDPSMTPLEAARRRDFTINSMALNLHTLQIVDPFNGKRDLDAGILRVTDPNTFVEDPLRALRAMQILARKCKTVDPNTLLLVRSMSNTFSSLPKERVFEEFKKLVMMADRPSIGINFLLESGWIEHFPELKAMIGCEQKKEWHPEGDVWIHSLQAIDAAASIRHLIHEEHRLAFMFGTFLHDVGKPDTTITLDMINSNDPKVKDILKFYPKKTKEDILLTSYGHDVAGQVPAESFMKRLTDNKSLINLTKAIVCFHMRPSYLFSGNSSRGAYIKLSRDISAVGGNLELMGRVCQCDSCAVGSGRFISAQGEPNWEHKISERLFSMASDIQSQPNSIKPKVTGDTLISLGIKPGPMMGKIMRLCLEIQDSDDTLSCEEILNRANNDLNFK